MRKFLVAVIAFALAGAATPSHAITYADSTHVRPANAPWMVSMWAVDSTSWDRYTLSEGGFICSGSLVGPTTVVVAAHCILGAGNDPWILVAQQDRNTSRGVVLMPRDVAINPNYNDTTLLNDIAVIDLYEGLKNKSYLRLPKNRTVAAPMLKNQPTVYGWGGTESANVTPYLRKAWLNDVSSKGARYYDTFDAASQIAASRKRVGKGFVTACPGDSGGPLVGTKKVSGKQVQYLLGITSYISDSGCGASAPTVFTRVSAFSDWLQQQLANFAAGRITNEINVDRAVVSGTPAKPLPTTTGTSGGSAFRQTSLTFTTELMPTAMQDLSAAEVTTWANPSDGGEITLAIHTKQTWSADGCGWQSLSATLGVGIMDPTSQLTDWRLAYTAKGCPTNGALMDVIDVNGVASPDCQAALFAQPDGSTLVKLTRACLPDPAHTYLRVWLGVGNTADIEPGTDSWAGPIDLSTP